MTSENMPQLQVFDTIPKGWSCAPLRDLVTSSQDGDWIELKDQGGKDFRLVQMSNIGCYEFVETGNYRYITNGTFESLNCTKIEVEDILVARMTDPKGRVGRAFCWTEDMPPSITSVDVCILKADKGKILPKYLELFLNHPLTLALSSALLGGTSHPRLKRRDIESLVVIYPDLSIQSKIIRHVLPNLSLVNDILPTIKLLSQELITSLFRSWFIDFDPVKAKTKGNFPYGMDDETAALFPDSFEVSEHGLLPKGWTWGTLLDISKIWTGGTPKTSESSYWEGDIPWVSGADLSSSELFAFDSARKITSLGVDKSSTKVLPVGTVMITARGTVGATKITAVPMAMSQTSFGFKAKKGISDALVYQASQETIRQLRSYAYGAVFDTFTQSTIDITKIAIAPLEILQAFGKIVDPLFETMKNSAKTEINLATTRDALLPRMMSGQLKVPTEA